MMNSTLTAAMVHSSLNIRRKVCKSDFPALGRFAMLGHRIYICISFVSYRRGESSVLVISQRTLHISKSHYCAAHFVLRYVMNDLICVRYNRVNDPPWQMVIRTISLPSLPPPHFPSMRFRFNREDVLNEIISFWNVFLIKFNWVTFLIL